MADWASDTSSSTLSGSEEIITGELCQTSVYTRQPNTTVKGPTETDALFESHYIRKILAELKNGLVAHTRALLEKVFQAW